MGLVCLMETVVVWITSGREVSVFSDGQVNVHIVEWRGLVVTSCSYLFTLAVEW